MGLLDVFTTEALRRGDKKQGITSSKLPAAGLGPLTFATSGGSRLGRHKCHLATVARSFLVLGTAPPNLCASVSVLVNELRRDRADRQSLLHCIGKVGDAEGFLQERAALHQDVTPGGAIFRVA